MLKFLSKWKLLIYTKTHLKVVGILAMEPTGKKNVIEMDRKFVLTCVKWCMSCKHILSWCKCTYLFICYYRLSGYSLFFLQSLVISSGIRQLWRAQKMFFFLFLIVSRKIKLDSRKSWTSCLLNIIINTTQLQTKLSRVANAVLRKSWEEKKSHQVLLNYLFITMSVCTQTIQIEKMVVFSFSSSG